MPDTAAVLNATNSLDALKTPSIASPASFERFQKYYLECLPGFELDISRMNFEESFFDRMRTKISTAYDRMRLIEEGALANWTEKWKVGHYWLRAPRLAPDKTAEREIEQTVGRIKAFAAEVHEGRICPALGVKFENILHIGIGGSALGPRLMERALGAPTQCMRAWFLDNTDPAGMERVLNSIALAKTLCIVASKSGGTKETENGMKVVESRLRALGLDRAKHMVAITKPGSKLDNYALSENWHPSFNIWDWVGGRTSITSAVGLLPGALQGFNVDEFLTGAAEMDDVTRTKAPLRNPAMMLALMWYHAGRGHGAKDMVILPYCDRLDLFAQYLQQLVMESLGKKHDSEGNIVHQGIAVYGNKGSTDQHAYVQQLRDGVNNFFVTFIGVGAPASHPAAATSADYLQAYLLGTREALTDAGRESMSLWLDDLAPRRFGQLIALYERAVGFYASFVNVNAYDQPGVEAGKKCADNIVGWLELVREIMHRERQAALSPEEVAEEVNKTVAANPELQKKLPALQAEMAFYLLKHLGALPKSCDK